MKSLVLIAALAIALVNAVALVPALKSYASFAPMASLAIATWLILRVALTRSEEAPPPQKLSERVEEIERLKAEARKAPENQADAEVITLLGLLQEKGRLLDFAMDDIASYSDAQVGAAARVVHQGCRDVLTQHFEVSPVAAEKEGGMITVPAEAAKSDYRLAGKISGEGPFTGTLVHKGWKTARVKLPRLIKADEGKLPVIAPAQVEIK